MDEFIKVRGARQHNLKNINLDIPKNKLVVFTGVSGSGKSSLAFDTIYAEGQRRYVESLSAYARQFLGIMNKPDVDSIEGLSPAISIDQKATSHNPRSTVGTVTEIYDYLRLLFARIGHPHCPNCGREIERQSQDQIVAQLFNTFETSLKLQKGMISLRYLILSPVVRDRKGEFSGLFDNIRAKGFTKVRIDGKIFDLSEKLVLIKTNKHTIDVVIDKVTVDKKLMRNDVAKSNLKSRLNDSIEQALSLSEGLIIVSEIKDASFTFPEKPVKMADHLFSQRFSCPNCNISIPDIEPRSFSFNSPHGACPKCSGIGNILKIDPEMVFNPNLSVSEGGILPFAKMFFHDTWFARVINTMAEKQNIPLRLPIRVLSEENKNKLLYGTGDELYTVWGTNRFGHRTKINETFTGIISVLEQKYQESESEFVRGEIGKFMQTHICEECSGTRLKKEALSVTIDKKSIAWITDLSIEEVLKWIEYVPKVLNDREKAIASSILKEINTRLNFLMAVGLEYLTLGRGASTLAGGEAQRIRLASQIGSGLTGVLYVLDEPSIGLHQRDNRKLIGMLKKLRDLGNTVVVVEHDRDVMENCDWIFDFGPQAGAGGGKVIFSGTNVDLKNSNSSTTGRYLKNSSLIKISSQRREFESEIILDGAKEHNLKSVNLSIPLGKLVCVTGVSGSGKSTLIVDTLYPALIHKIQAFSRLKIGSFDKISGYEFLDKVVLVDQSPIGRTPKSNPATYTGVFTAIRDLFSELPDARVRGYKPGRFSFNVKGGRCEACEGEGQIKIEMQFLSDVFVTCEVCHGQRYNQETLEVRFKGKNIAEVLAQTALEAKEFFINIPGIFTKIETLCDVGLGYVHLGQPAPTLSGGEAQRVKLATELSKRQTGKTLYILDEPTTGLHFADIQKLLEVLNRLVEKGNTVVVIEHNLDVVKNADHIIDLGPEGGDKGGQIIAEGTPIEISKVKNSYTGQFLKEVL